MKNPTRFNVVEKAAVGVTSAGGALYLLLNGPVDSAAVDWATNGLGIWAGVSFALMALDLRAVRQRARRRSR